MRVRKLLVLILVIGALIVSGSVILGSDNGAEKNGKDSGSGKDKAAADTVAPEIVLEGEDTVNIYQGDEYVDPGFKATDDVDGDITEKVNVSHDIDSSVSGIYTVTYTAEDGAGNKAEALRTVKVRNSPDAEVDKSGPGLPVLMYHWFYDQSAGETGANGNWMEIGEFSEQMKYLSENGYSFPSWDEVYDYLDGVIQLPEKSVVLTFDDGHESFFRLAVPVLEQYGIKATSFVITEEVTKEFIQEKTSDNVIFRSHSHDMHRAGSDGNGRFMTMSYDDATADLNTSADILGIAQVFCYPYGHYSDSTKKALADTGYVMAFTVEYGRIYPGMDKLSLPRIRMSAGESLNAYIKKVS